MIAVLASGYGGPELWMKDYGAFVIHQTHCCHCNFDCDVCGSDHPPSYSSLKNHNNSKFFERVEAATRYYEEWERHYDEHGSSCPCSADEADPRFYPVTYWYPKYYVEKLYDELDGVEDW